MCHGSSIQATFGWYQPCVATHNRTAIGEASHYQNVAHPEGAILSIVPQAASISTVRPGSNGAAHVERTRRVVCDMLFVHSAHVLPAECARYMYPTLGIYTREDVMRFHPD